MSHTPKSQALYRRAKELIPGGTQLLSKRPELFAPDQWPAYYQQAQGCEVVDLDGRHYLDFTGMGIGACLLGYADPDVTAAVIARVQAGSMCTLNSPDEVELAELLIALHPWAENVRYARSGGEAMSIAIRIARSHTDRDLIAFCGYHGWHDWYLAANRSPAGTVDNLTDHAIGGLSPRGVPSPLAGTALAFSYNRVEQVEEIFHVHGPRIAAVVMEPTRSIHPQTGFLETIRKLCDQHRALLVFDEITAGWRFALGGAHLLYGVQPDIAVFAKTISNGHPMAAIIGRAEAMQAAQGSFISSTYWTEAVGPAAAIATIRKMQAHDVPGHIAQIGILVRDGLAQIATDTKVPLVISGHPALTFCSFDHPDAAAMQTFVTARMLERGFLSGSGFYPSLAHKIEHVSGYLAAAMEVFAELARAVSAGSLLEKIGGPVRHTGFQRLA